MNIYIHYICIYIYKNIHIYAYINIPYTKAQTHAHIYFLTKELIADDMSGVPCRAASHLLP